MPLPPAAGSTITYSCTLAGRSQRPSFTKRGRRQRNPAGFPGPPVTGGTRPTCPSSSLWSHPFGISIARNPPGRPERPPTVGNKATFKITHNNGDTVLPEPRRVSDPLSAPTVEEKRTARSATLARRSLGQLHCTRAERQVALSPRSRPEPATAANPDRGPPRHGAGPQPSPPFGAQKGSKPEGRLAQWKPRRPG